MSGRKCRRSFTRNFKAWPCFERGDRVWILPEVRLRSKDDRRSKRDESGSWRGSANRLRAIGISWEESKDIWKISIFAHRQTANEIRASMRKSELLSQYVCRSISSSWQTHARTQVESPRPIVASKPPRCIFASSPLRLSTYLYSQSFDVVGAVGSPREIGKIELDLIPAVVESHRHRADERLHPRRRLIIARAKTTSHVLIV